MAQMIYEMTNKLLVTTCDSYLADIDKNFKTRKEDTKNYSQIWMNGVGLPVPPSHFCHRRPGLETGRAPAGSLTAPNPPGQGGVLSCSCGENDLMI